MNRELARKVADAVLYEGYMLYPYRPSAIKNRQRWSFGILYPPAYPEVKLGTERFFMHSECLLEATPEATVQIQLRFLHLDPRQYAKYTDGRFEPMPSLIVDGQLFESWDQPAERSLNFHVESLASPQHFPFAFPGSTQTEPLLDRAGQVAGNVTRTQHEVNGSVSVSAETIDGSYHKLIIDVRNATQMTESVSDRDSALLDSLLSAHVILTATNAQFVSLLDPPASIRDVVSGCRNIGNFPVLVGSAPEREMLLCSPIVLYDYPQIAPESASDFYDATEIDEMLTLRVMTLTDDETNAMRHADDHVRNLLQRTEQTAREQLIKTHGTIRSMRPVSEQP